MFLSVSNFAAFHRPPHTGEGVRQAGRKEWETCGRQEDEGGREGVGGDGERERDKQPGEGSAGEFEWESYGLPEHFWDVLDPFDQFHVRLWVFL